MVIHGVLYAPDYVVNIGGALAITGIEALGWSRAEAEERVLTVGDTLRRVFDMAAVEGITTEAAARRIAEARLATG
jgi:glutamate dehydrogenase/leucine dehydrogenase